MPTIVAGTCVDCGNAAAECECCDICRHFPCRCHSHTQPPALRREVTPSGRVITPRPLPAYPAAVVKRHVLQCPHCDRQLVLLVYADGKTQVLGQQL